MTFKQLQDEVIALRFDESRRSSVKSWINLGYENIWNRANWNFKIVPQTALTLTGGSRTPTMPADLAKVLDVYDQYNAPLCWVPQQDFEYDYASTTSPSSGTPSTYTVINRQLYLDPVPGSALSFKLTYKRRLSHVDAVSGVIGGVMVNDSDQPLWPAEHDYTLIFESCLIGEMLTGDPTSTRLVQQRDEKLASMIADLTWDQEGAVTQWGGNLVSGY